MPYGKSVSLKFLLRPFTSLLPAKATSPKKASPMFSICCTAVVTQAKETQQKDKENNGKQKIGSYGVRASVDYVLMAKQRWQVMLAKTRIMIVLTDAESDFCFKSRVLCDIHISCTDSPHWTSGSPGVCMRMSRS